MNRPTTAELDRRLAEFRQNADKSDSADTQNTFLGIEVFRESGMLGVYGEY